MSQLYERAQAIGTFAQNVSWFSPDYVPVAGTSKSSNLIIQIQANTSVVVQATIDGVNFFDINSGVAVPAGWSQFEIFATKNDAVNFRTSDGSGVTVDARLVNDLSG